VPDERCPRPGKRYMKRRRIMLGQTDSRVTQPPRTAPKRASARAGMDWLAEHTFDMTRPEAVILP
jgi:hypothetical protein